MSVEQDQLRVLPLGGLGEIGMNCLVLESPRSMIVVDCGLYFTELQHFGVEYIIPRFQYLLERSDRLTAFVITHGHEDHIGALTYAWKAGVRAPIYCSAFTALMIRKRFEEAGLEKKVDIRIFKSHETVDLDYFQVTPLPVNHSIVEAHALKIQTPLGCVLHTGDFRCDSEPYYGSSFDWKPFEEAGDKGVLLLLSDSTNVEVDQPSRSESDLMINLDRLVASAEGMIVVSMFASNIARLGQFIELARKQDRKIVVSGRSMEANTALAQDAGYFSGAAEDLFIPIEDMDSYDKKKLMVFSTGSQGEYRSALARIAAGEHKQIRVEKGDLVIMSSKFIPGNEKDISRLINNLYAQGAEVLYDAVEFVHVSGHASRPDLKKMIEAIKPKFFMPVHGEYRHLVKHGQLAEECGLSDDQIQVVRSGTVLELSKDGFKIVDQWDDYRQMVESYSFLEMTRVQLKDRRKLAESGVVFCMLAVDFDMEKVIAGPHLFLKGLVAEDREEAIMLEIQRMLKGAFREISWRDSSTEDLQEELRILIRRLLNQLLGRKPTVLVTVLTL